MQHLSVSFMPFILKPHLLSKTCILPCEQLLLVHNPYLVLDRTAQIWVGHACTHALVHIYTRANLPTLDDNSNVVENFLLSCLQSLQFFRYHGALCVTRVPVLTSLPSETVLYTSLRYFNTHCECYFMAQLTLRYCTFIKPSLPPLHYCRYLFSPLPA